MILMLFIPGLIFESGFNTNWHIFLKESQQALLLAGPGVVLNACLIGGVMHYFAHYISLFSKIDEDGYDWSWSFSIMFGSIVSATDPVAVVALLKTLGASKRLSTLIEAESLLNDGTAFVMFEVLKTFAASPDDTTFAEMIVIFVQLAFGGFAMGVLFGYITYFCLSRVYNDFQIEVTFTFAIAYLAFYMGDFMAEVSGVLVLVFLSLLVSKNRQSISPMVEETMHHFWEMVGFIANTLLFFVTGQIIAFRLWENSAHFDWISDLLILLLLYICCHIVRAVAIWIMFPALQNTGYGCTTSDSIVMVYGGLRGAIGLALALIVETESSFDRFNRDRVLFHTCGIVILTLVVNASTIKYVVEYLGLNRPPQDTAALFRAAIEDLLHHIHVKMSDMKLDKHYSGANWTKVSDLQPKYEELFFKIFGRTMYEMNAAEEEEISIEEDDTLIINMLAQLQRADREVRNRQELEKRVIQVMKSSYWMQFEKGLISADAVSILVESAESAMDDHDLSHQKKDLKKWFKIPKYIKILHQSNISIVKKLAEKMLFSNLGFAIEISAGYVYASKNALEFTHILLEQHTIEERYVRAVDRDLSKVTQWIINRSRRVERIYPDVHAAIQTSHAAHALLFHQKSEIDHLLHKGFFDEAEHARMMKLCDRALQDLFQTGYSTFLVGADDANILIESPLFTELSAEQKKRVILNAKPSRWFKKDEVLMAAGTKTRQLFVITRGCVAVHEHEHYTTRYSSMSIALRDVEKKKSMMSSEEYAVRESMDMFSSADVGLSCNRSIWEKKQGDCLDVYTLIQDAKHEHNFVVTTDQFHGYWIPLTLLSMMKEENIDFWDTLWKYAAVDVLRYYFVNETVLKGHNLHDLEQYVFDSPLSFYDPSKPHRCQIRVNRGFGILLNGCVTHINDITVRAVAPAILPCVPDPYVAVDESVVLLLDFTRGKMNTNAQMDPRMARKLLGMQMSIDDVAESESWTDNEYDDEEIIDSDLEEPAVLNVDELLDAVAGDDDIIVLSAVDEKIDGISQQLPELKIQITGDDKEEEKDDSRVSKHLSVRSGSMKRHSRPGSGTFKRLSALKDMSLNERKLPNSVLRDSIDEWTESESFSVLKFIIAKNMRLFDYMKLFQIQHVQREIRERERKRKFIDENNENDVSGGGMDNLPNPASFRYENSRDLSQSESNPTLEKQPLNAAQSMDISANTSTNLFARPTSKAARLSVTRKLQRSKYRSSRYVFSQQNRGDGGGVRFPLSLNLNLKGKNIGIGESTMMSTNSSSSHALGKKVSIVPRIIQSQKLQRQRSQEAEYAQMMQQHALNAIPAKVSKSAPHSTQVSQAVGKRELLNVDSTDAELHRAGWETHHEDVIPAGIHDAVAIGSVEKDADNDNNALLKERNP